MAKMTKASEALLNLHYNGSESSRVELINETVTTSDLPKQLEPAMDFILRDGYTEIETSWTEYAVKKVVPDFDAHTNYRFEFDDSDIPGSKDGIDFDTGGLAGIGELGEYPTIRFEASQEELKTRKNGAKVAISWEATIRSQKFDVLAAAVQNLGRRTKVAENQRAARQLVTRDGVNAKNFNVGNGNLVAGNPALTYDSLLDAVNSLAIITNPKGRRIASPAKFILVVPSTLYAVAQRYVNLTDYEVTVDGRTYREPNLLRGKISKVVEVPDFATIAQGKADTAWFLLPDLGDPAFESVANVFLAGHETPALFTYSDQDNGGGDFEIDSYQTKVRHVVDGAMIGTVGTLASKGDGTAN